MTVCARLHEGLLFMGFQINCGKQPAAPLEMLADTEIRRSGFRLRFPEELERRYRRDTAIGRSQELRAVSRIALAVFLSIGILKTLLLVPHPRWELASFFWVLMIGATLIVQPVLRPAVPSLKRETAIFGFCVTLCLSVLAMISLQRTPFPLQSMVVATLPVNFVLIFVRLPFPLATGFTAAVGCAYVVALLIHPDLSQSERVFLIGLLLAETLPTLGAVHGLERGSRRLYLHGLLQRLNYDRVLSHNAVLTDLSYRDPLTGIANRRRLNAELQLVCDKEDTCATFLMIDIDWFKGFNDRYGHPLGDRCIQEVATCLAGALREGDLVARFGGEEFGVLLPTMPMQEAVLVAERLRAAVAAYPFMVGTRIVRITVSVGLASIVGFDEPARVIDTADKAMYRAKRAGRNRVGGPWLKMAS